MFIHLEKNLRSCNDTVHVNKSLEKDVINVQISPLLGVKTMECTNKHCFKLDDSVYIQQLFYLLSAYV